MTARTFWRRPKPAGPEPAKLGGYTFQPRHAWFGWVATIHRFEPDTHVLRYVGRSWAWTRSGVLAKADRHAQRKEQARLAAAQPGDAR